MDCDPAIVKVAEVIAEETSLAKNDVPGGALSPSMSQVAIVEGEAQLEGGAGWELITSVSVAELPVSEVPMNKFPVVLT